MRSLFDPVAYYLVLFDFEDLYTPKTINARIWEVDPRSKGFAFCLIDYYFNIKAKSKSGAPFNLWPFLPKFQMMRPELIYHARINNDDTVTTLVFPGGPGSPQVYPISPFPDFRRTKIPTPAFEIVARGHGVELDGQATRSKLLKAMEAARESEEWDDLALADELADAYYAPRVRGYEEWLPPALQA